MNPIIVQAIRKHRILEFSYKDFRRKVEPHIYGIQRDTGNEILSGYQTAGLSHSDERSGWRSFLVEEIQELTPLDRSFAKARDDYNPHDPRFKIVFARL